MTRESLGEFEQMVLVAILQVGQNGGEVYGVPIVDEIHRRTGRKVGDAAVYVALRRLEQRGLIASWMSEPTSERGGKAKRCVKVTPAGVRAVRDAREAMDRMWKGLEPSPRRVR